MPPQQTPPATAVYQLKITLKGVRPPIWRRLLVGDTVTLATLHRIIQASMGWEDSHMHEFEFGGVRYGEPSIDSYHTVKDERKFRLVEVAPKTKGKFRYTYDFGDNWEHEIEVEELLPVDPAQVLPQCIKGKRACPPEHVGGAWGYQALLEAKVKPNHPERERFAWHIEHFDPEALDFGKINAKLKKIK